MAKAILLRCPGGPRVRVRPRPRGRCHRHQQQRAPMDQPETRGIAIVRGFQPCCIAPLLLDGRSRDFDLLDTLADLPLDEHRGRIGIVEHQRGMGGTAPQTLLDPHRNQSARQFPTPAIDDDPLFALRELEGERGRAAIARMTRPRRRRRIEHQCRLARIDPLVTPVAAVLARPCANAACRDQGIDPQSRGRARALPPRPRSPILKSGRGTSRASMVSSAVGGSRSTAA